MAWSSSDRYGRTTANMSLVGIEGKGEGDGGVA